MRALVAEYLRRDGHDVLEVGDGARLLVRIGHQYRIHEPAEKIDLVVTDLRMPIITGLDILRGLRSAHCTTPVILMTAFGDQSIRNEVTDLGAILLNKPFPMAELQEKALQLLSSAADGSRSGIPDATPDRSKRAGA